MKPSAGEYPAFYERLARFLRSQGMKSFRISLVTDYTVTCPEGEVLVYLEGLDILSEAKCQQVLRTVCCRERRLRRQLQEIEQQQRQMGEG